MVGTDATQTLTNKTSTTFGVGNATPSASGAGITFPAAVSASTDANTLDDYEEGTWTTTWTNVTGTPATLIGYYVKIGKIVYWTYRPAGASISGTGNSTAFTMPFPVAQNGSGSFVTTNISAAGILLIYDGDSKAYPQTFASSSSLVFNGCYIAT
jgi:hypothetical protein